MKKREDHQFDEQIRQKMTNLRPETGAPDWSAFEEQLDAAEALDAGPAEAGPREVDEVIFAKMHQYEVPYEPAHWARMEAKLNEWFTWPQYVLRYKTMELALFLLLFITCWQYLPKLGTPVAGSPPAERSDYTGVPGDHQSVQETPAEIQELPTDNTTSGLNQLADEQGQPPAEAYKRNNPLTQSTLPEPANEAITPGTKAQKNRVWAPLSPLSDTKRPQSLRSNTVAEASALPFPALLSPVAATENPTFDLAAAALLPGLPFEALAEPEADLGETKVRRMKKRPALLVGMFGSADYNHILVPASSEKRLTESLERAAIGYGGGLSLSADFGRLEVETGAIYAARYYPVGIVYVRGSLLSGLRGDELRTTELNMLSIPLHVRYDYFQHNKWRAYVLGGGSVQVAFQTNYYTAEAPQFDFLPAMPPPVTDGPAGGESEIDRIRRNGQGWFEGGKFKDNAYLTLNFGFGAERYFSERWSLFVQPVYQHSVHYFKNIDGLGPNNDRINSLSVLIGTRVRLK
jgi:hypothetical protein